MGRSEHLLRPPFHRGRFPNLPPSFMSLRVRLWRTWQSHRAPSYQRIRGDCFVTAFLAKTHWAHYLSTSLRGHQKEAAAISPYLFAFTSTRDCFVATLLAMTYCPLLFCLMPLRGLLYLPSLRGLPKEGRGNLTAPT